MQETERLIHVQLDEKAQVRRKAEVEHERAVAIYDLIEDNHFSLVGDHTGPYILHLSIEENRMQFDVRSEAGVPLAKVPLALAPFKRIVKDYFMVCETYYNAIRHEPPSRIEAIDMGRRGLHNEGSDLLRERLKDKIDVDSETARRLFTLICVLHIRG